MCGSRTWIGSHRMRSDRVCSTRHGAPSYHWEILLIIDGGFWIQAFLRSHMSQCRISRWLLQVRRRRMRPGVIADKMEVLTRGRGDTEGLLHETVRFIAIPIGALIAAIASTVVAPTRTFWSFPGSGHGGLRHAVPAPFTFHLSIGQEAARNATGTP